MTTKSYEAHVIPKRPACTDRGWTCTVYAKNATEAKARARYEARRFHAYDRLDGALVVTVKES